MAYLTACIGPPRLFCFSGIIGFSVRFRNRADRDQQSAHDAAAARRARRARWVIFLLEQKERLLGAILLGNNLVNIMASALATRLFLDLFGETGVVYATLVMTVMVVIFMKCCQRPTPFWHRI